MALARPAAALPNSGIAAADPQREFAFSKSDFQFLAALAYERAGISLADSKRNLVYGRLSRRLRALGVQGVEPDVTEARSWYEKAKEYGSAEAAQRLQVLVGRAP